MSAFEPKLIDALRSLAASLQLSMLLPATLLVSGVVWLVAPDTFEAVPVLIIAVPVLTISYLLNAFNMVILRALEGYILAAQPPLRYLRQRQLGKFQQHQANITYYEHIIKQCRLTETDWALQGKLPQEVRDTFKQWRQGWIDRIAHERERLEERFPPVPERVLATGLGNTIAAFEYYPEQRYCINTVELWPRFVPTLLEKKYASIIESEKALLDFFVNLLLVGSIVWVIAVPVFAWSGRGGAGLIALLVPPLLYLVYRGACVAAANWGATIKSAYDLFRFDLIKALNLSHEPPEQMDLTKERKLWQDISKFLAFGETKFFAGFDYTGLIEPEPDEDSSGAKQ